ncbi:MAG: hypothetical protein ACJAYC_002911 [Halieaceae bacterium]|jgi:hypothetical protein
MSVMCCDFNKEFFFGSFTDETKRELNEGPRKTLEYEI